MKLQEIKKLIKKTDKKSPIVMPVDYQENPPNTVSSETELSGSLVEVAPPGREKQVKALKKKFGEKSAFKIAWASYNKKSVNETFDKKKEDKDKDDDKKSKKVKLTPKKDKQSPDKKDGKPEDQKVTAVKKNLEMPPDNQDDAKQGDKPEAGKMVPQKPAVSPAKLDQKEREQDLKKTDPDSEKIKLGGKTQVIINPTSAQTANKIDNTDPIVNQKSAWKTKQVATEEMSSRTKSIVLSKALANLEKQRAKEAEKLDEEVVSMLHGAFAKHGFKHVETKNKSSGNKLHIFHSVKSLSDKDHDKVHETLVHHGFRPTNFNHTHNNSIRSYSKGKADEVIHIMPHNGGSRIEHVREESIQEGDVISALGAHIFGRVKKHIQAKKKQKIKIQGAKAKAIAANAKAQARLAAAAAKAQAKANKANAKNKSNAPGSQKSGSSQAPQGSGVGSTAKATAQSVLAGSTGPQTKTNSPKPANKGFVRQTSKQYRSTPKKKVNKGVDIPTDPDKIRELLKKNQLPVRAGTGVSESQTLRTIRKVLGEAMHSNGGGIKGNGSAGQDSSGDDHPLNTIRKAISLGSATIEHDNGEKSNITSTDAHGLLDKYHASDKPAHKEHVISTIRSSKSGLKSIQQNKTVAIPKVSKPKISLGGSAATNSF